jgi:YgiT-type zinc finger domain-containing protein
MRTCPNCHVGNLHPKSVTYANWHVGQFVTAPNLPAWSCDVCAWCQIEPEALHRLLWLIGPVTRPALSQPRHTSTPTDERRPESADPDRNRQSA